MTEQILEQIEKKESKEDIEKEKTKQKIIAVIPAHNEEKYIQKVVEETKKYADEVIVVDDASKDNTGNIARNAGAVVLRHEVNLGLGATLKTGCDAALILDADLIITLDGDGQHDPKDIPDLLKKLKETNSDIIFGEREFNENMPVVKKTGNKFFHEFSKDIFGIKIRDTQTGFRIFSSDAYKKIRWKSSDYAVASEILINTEENKLKYTSEKIKTIYYENQKGTTIIDGIKIANKMLDLKFNKQE